MKHHFLKTTLSTFGKLLVAKVFGFILSCTILMALSGLVGSLITQICSVIMMVVLMFSSAWDIGMKDANRASIGEIQYDRWLGLKVSLLVCAPDFIFATMLILTKFGVVGEAFPVLFGILNSNYLPFHQAVLTPTLTVAEHALGSYILSAATVLIAPFCVTVGYYMGICGVSLGDSLLYNTPEAKERHAQRLKKRRNRKNRLWR